MKKYPLRIYVKTYGGRKPELQRKYLAKIRMANAIEAYLNEKMSSAAPEESKSFDYWEIANALGMYPEGVRDILFAVDGGHNGITITRPLNVGAES